MVVHTTAAARRRCAQWLRRCALPVLAVLCAQAPAQAQWRPTAQVEYIIPAAAGGAVDTYGRVMKKIFDSRGQLGEQTFIISNKPGGHGMIATAPVVKRTGDAHLFTMLSSGYILGQVLGDFKHDLRKDFTIGPILFEESLAVAVPADSPIRNATDLVERLRRDPASLRIAVAPGLKGHIHIGILKPLKTAGVDTTRLTVAPFRSSAESLNALRGGHVDVVSASSTNMVPGLQSGALRVIAVSSAQRLPGVFAQVPTWREQGVDSVFTSVQGVMFPPGLSEEQIRFWDERFRELSREPDWINIMRTSEVTPRFMDHVQAKAYVTQQLQSSTELLRELELLP